MRARPSLSDAQLYEEYPATYAADVSRRHRWIRGDWQIASWLLSRVPARAAPGEPNPLSVLSQWKILDNLRRSVAPAALTLLLVLGWTVARPAWFWTLVVIGIIVAPPLIAWLLDLFRKPEDALARQHLVTSMRSLGNHLAQTVFTVACLPHEAWFSLDAVMRTNWRIFVSRRRLLEWLPSGHSNGAGQAAFAANLRLMWIAPTVAVALAAWLAVATPATLKVAGPVLLLWFFAPAFAWWISRPLPRPSARLNDAQLVFLRKVARKTWAFFETFVGPDDHWLPPDNLQEHPVAVVAHRTSPTNMGLSLLANLTAYDFGYLPAGQLIERTANALDTMATLDRHEGHFYNWYDTQTLQPLSPLYISSVDSGNLAGHLLTLRPGLLAIADQPILGPRVFDGLYDTMRILADTAAPGASPALARLQTDIESAYDAQPGTLAAMHTWLTRLAESAAKACAGLDVPAGAAPQNDAQWWAQALARQCRGALDELALLAPWLALPAPTARLRKALAPLENPTLREIAAGDAQGLNAMAQELKPAATPAEQEWLDALGRHVAAAAGHASERIGALERLALLAGEFAVMRYDFLYDSSRHLLAIGYNVGERRRDASYYDLLASEARLTSFHRDRAGRAAAGKLVRVRPPAHDHRRRPVLLSWSGSMFEYLMPLLVMPTYENTLLDRTYQRRRRPADRLRPAARRRLGNFGMRLQHRRHRAQLPIPGVRRAGPRFETRPRGGPRDRAVRVRARADGRAREGVRESAAAGRGGHHGQIRLLRGGRLYASRACRAGSRAR